LPPGLALDRFTGTISGTPDEAGIFSFTVRVFDYPPGPGVAVDAEVVILPDPCPWDCAGVEGNVNIVDLLALLAQWAAAGTCDGDGSDSVGINDLLGLLSDWGACF
jgi:hypothetical protein